MLDGVRICKENDVDVILAVGGGSVLDCSKAIATGAKYDGDPWDLISYKAFAADSIPIVDIITLAATGSEYDSGGVISRTETNDKIGYIDPLNFPAVSFLDPTYTFTVSKKQTAAGCADAMNHIMEQYFCEDSTLLNDGFMEAGLKSLMINAKKCIENPRDHLRLQRYLLPGQQRNRLAVPRDRTRAQRLLRHHPRRRPRDHHAQMDEAHSQRTHSAALC